jgi:hypothetical protein
MAPSERAWIKIVLVMNSSRSIKNYIALAVVVAALLLLNGTVPAGQSNSSASAAARIKFARGAITASVKGRFTRSQPRPCYVLNARSGQHMTVNIAAVTPGLAMGGQVTSPSGMQDGGPGGIIFDGELKETGDYRICAFQHTMATDLPAGNFIVEVVIR